MTDRQKQLIEGYLPTPRDPELEMNEYYVLDQRDRPTKVMIVGIAPKDEETIYQVITTTAGRSVHGPYEVAGYFGESWYYMGSLYDNKEDCRACIHSWYHGWEKLRELQRKEGS